MAELGNITKLPFKPDHEVLPDNFKVCEGRLKSLKNKLAASNILHEYNQIFSEYEENDAQHRDYLTFLWYELQAEDEQVVIYRFLRVVFGITSSPFLLNGTIRHHLSNYLEKEREIAQRVIDDLYVDDLVSCCNKLEEGKALYDRSKAILSEAGFNLRKWVTNDKELAGYIASRENGDNNLLGKDNDMTYFEATSPNVTVEHEVVLGVEWDTTSNELIFRFDDLISKCATVKHTKRNMLSISASIFDPLGFIAPVTAKIKTIFQLLCKDKLDWDEIIPEKIADVWTKFVEELKQLAEELEVDRVKASCGNENSLVGRVDVEVPTKVVNFSNTTAKGMPNNSRCSISAKRVRKVDGDIVNDSVLTVDEYNKALEMWIKEEQILMKEQANYTNLCASLRLFEDKVGLMRLKGRFANSSLEYEEQHPVILRSKDNSYFTRLIILDAHI
ncbi:Hypothetical predicted protein [Paramuricea clavata]|uniref:Uncharacterized protein n=1 Tax=Paramuricea clavata TaxID=317549 RepID=A0A6S7GC86_PARCT|nr:Hypothetical predicted protein [Paramuricea clavata]